VAAVAGQRRRGGEPTVLRGLSFAIVDEADSVFIDEARTPLILSATLDRSDRSGLVDWALAGAATLREGEDYTLERALMRVRLTDALRDRLRAEIDGEPTPVPVDAPALPSGAALRDCTEKLVQALCALLLYRRDQQYVVVEGKVQIVDESTGRVMPDRAWERGLHQMIEAKEGLEPSGERATLARITYQRFFRRYLRLGGHDRHRHRGGGRDRPRLPACRWPACRCTGPRAGATKARVACATRGRSGTPWSPACVGTPSSRAGRCWWARARCGRPRSSRRVLAAAGIGHVVLNAKQDCDEAAVIALAGQRGTVTVATNMAGRGTDIALAEGVAAAGGLHVILTEYHESPRIDRQLFGRAARQGDPGSGEALVALDDELFTVHAPRLAAWAAALASRDATLPPWALALLRRAAQAAAEARSRTARMASLKHDRRLASVLAFSGRGE
jgi:preprotein translocase subunit SecA